jgi:hypothetical protein
MISLKNIIARSLMRWLLAPLLHAQSYMVDW